MLNKILNYDLHDEETLKADGFDEAIIGITNNQILVYSIEKNDRHINRTRRVK